MKSKVYRIIDVNINRATEGLRVVEEICRFILEDQGLTLEVKRLRGQLCKNIRISEYQKEKTCLPAGTVRKTDYQILKTREAIKDVGRKTYTKNEQKRKGVEDIFFANIKRAQEAVRSLEEFSKLIDPKLGQKFKAIRFKVYDLEKRIFSVLSKDLKLDFDVYLVTDAQWNHIKIARKAIADGAKIIQLRDKKASKDKILKWAKQIGNIARRAGVIFIINDYVDIAKKVDADGVHLGQDDLSIDKARKILGPNKIIGASTHSFTQAMRAQKQGADYIAVGPIFSTPTKPGVKAVGLGLLRKVVQKVKIPVVAIGGIDRSNIGKVIKTGCKRAAVVRARDLCRYSGRLAGDVC